MQKENIGQELALLRKSAGLSLQQLGNRIGMKKEFIYRVEHGKTQPTINTISRILIGLDYELSISFVKKPGS